MQQKYALPLVYMLIGLIWAPCIMGAQTLPHETQGNRLTLLPLAGFSSDDGPGYGLRFNLYQYDGVSVPYHRAYGLQFFFTSKGKWVHRLQCDLPNLRSGDRVVIDLHYDRETQAAYYGRLSDADIDQYTQDEQTYETHYKTLGATWIHALRAPWNIRTGFVAGHNRITPNSSQNALLDQLAPVGANGGWLIQLHSAMRYDTRDNYLHGTRGVLEELLLEYGYGQSGTYNGGQIRYEHRHFVPLGQTWTLAQRLIGALTLGDVPFYEQPKLGSSKTVRGLAPARERGEGQILLNSELRWQGIQISQRRQITLGMIFFVDTGQIFKRADGPTLGDWSTGVGGGLRIYWYSTIMRLDYGKSRTHQSLYMRFEHTF